MPRYARSLAAASAVTLLLTLLGCHTPGEQAERFAVGEIMLHSRFATNLRALSMPGGRLSGTENARQAEEFIAAQTRSYGLKNVRFHAFEMHCWKDRATEVTLLVDPPRRYEGAVALGRTQSTPAGGVTAELVDVGDGRPEDFAAKADRLAGRFALTRDAGPTRWRKLELVRQHGGAGMLVMMPPEREPVIGNGHPEPRPEPAVVIRHDADLLGRLAAGETPRVNISLETENWVCHPRNVIAEIPGRGPHAREVVILCGHLDSWHLAEGALDNGSGSTTVREVARALAASGWQPRRTVRFIWFMGEELGLCGSEAYVRDHADEMDHIVAVINLDMPGRPQQIGHYGHPEIEPFLRQFVSDLSAYEMSPEIRTFRGTRSDHAPFMRAGVCALAIAGDIGPGGRHYHTTGDTYETVDRRGTIPTAAVVATLVRRLADADERPTVRQPSSSGGAE